MSTEYIEPFEVKKNTRINYAFYDGNNLGEMKTANITNIDNDKPTIATLSGSSNKGNFGWVTIIGMSDNAGSGVSGYYISKSNKTPTETSVSWIPVTSSTYGHKVMENGTYYVWIIDKLGNISDPRSCTVSGIVAKVTYVKLNDITMLAGKTQSIPISNDGEYSKMESSSSTEGILQFYGPSTINAKSVGTTTLTVTLTNYDGTTVSGSCTVTVKELKYTTIDDSYGTIRNIIYSYPNISFQWKMITSTIPGFTKKLIGKMSIPPTGSDKSIQISSNGVYLEIDKTGNVYIKNPASNACSIYGYDSTGTTYSYFAIIQ